MEKYFVLSFDDGTKSDRRVIEILNEYGLKGTFNLNSGLQDYKYYMEGKLVERLDLKENVQLYKNHEVASHTKTHANIFKLSDKEALAEVVDDIKALEEIFNRKITSIGIPYADYDEDKINLIKNNTDLKCFRYPKIKDKDDFSMPIDPYHIYKNCVYDDIDCYEKIDAYINSDIEKGVFVLLADPYKIEIYDKWDYFINLIKYIKSHDELTVVTMTEASELLFN